jgi:hypothetical protein
MPNSKQYHELIEVQVLLRNKLASGNGLDARKRALASKSKNEVMPDA